MGSSDTIDEATELRRVKRRKRLQDLRGGASKGKAEGGRAAKAGAENGANSELRRRAFQRAFRVLTETPADDAGTVAGTSFTQTGVIRLLDTLRTRAEKPNGPGAKAASRLLQFLKPAEGEKEQVHGASIEKLRRFSKMGQNIGRGRANRDGGRA